MKNKLISAIEDCYSIAYINPKPLSFIKRVWKRTFIKINLIFKKDEENKNEKKIF